MTLDQSRTPAGAAGTAERRGTRAVRPAGQPGERADPELLEASILEIRALQSRYGCALRSLKAMCREN